MKKKNVKRLPDQVSLCSTRPAMTNTLGRSIVEMLGVLAIVGVLSAGAMAGYSKAMFRHRVNQTIDIFSQVLQRFSELEQKGWGKDIFIGREGGGSSVDLVKYGLLDTCQETTLPIDNTETTCRLPIGYLWMDFSGGGSSVIGWFEIGFTDSKSCVAFASAGWENVMQPDLWEPTGFVMVGNKFAYHGQKLSMEDIVEQCKRCDNTGYCNFEIGIRSDL